MKTKQKLAAIATGIFTLSFFLPAFGEGSGLACFDFCLRVMLGHDGDMRFGSGQWMYYSGFVAANVLFLVLALILMFSARGFSRTRCWLALLVSLQVLSWFVVNIKGSDPLGLGYYVWLGAFVLLFFTHFLSHPGPSPDMEKGQNPGLS